MLQAHLLATIVSVSGTCSQNSSAVIILVVLAIGRGVSASCSYKTCPLTASTTIELSALMSGAFRGFNGDRGMPSVEPETGGGASSDGEIEVVLD